MNNDSRLTIGDFMRNHIIKKEEVTAERGITHTRIGDTKHNIFGGSYHVPDEDYGTLMRLVFNQVIRKNAPEYFTEKQLESGGPIAIDLDFRYDYAVTEKKHSKEHVDDLIYAYLAEIQKIFQFDQETRFSIFVMEKEAVNRLADKKVTKDGIHIIIGLQMDRAIQVHLRKLMVEQIRDLWDLPIINTWEDVFDEGVSLGTVNWQLIGCRKPDHEPYKLKYIYHISYDESDGEVVVTDETKVGAFITETTVAQLSVRYTKHPALFIHPDFAQTYAELKGMAAQTGTQKRSATIQRQNTMLMTTGQGAGHILNVRSAAELQELLDHFLESIDASDYELKEAHAYTMTLPESYYGEGSFAKWIRVGWALRNISDRLFIVWVAFSAQSAKFDYGSIRELWEKWQGFDLNNPNGLTKRSIMHWSKKDAAEAYSRVRYDSVDYYIDLTVDSIPIAENERHSKGCGDYDIARVLHQLFKDEYVCVSVKASIWYRYQNHRWKEIDSGTSLRRAISEELRKLYSQKAFKLLTQMSAISADDEKYKKLETKAVKLKNIIARLSQTNDKQKIMTEARELFYDGSFLKKLDTNPYLLCFANGVVDFKEKRFRAGYPEDCLSRCTNIDYITHYSPEKHDVFVKEIEDFMNKLFPVPELRKYMWDHLASVLIGTSANQTFNMYIGIGQNGKSVLVNLMEKMLGDYKGDVPLTLLTQQRTKIGGLAPELVQLKGVRYAVMQEPSKGDRINEGPMKQITSGVDPIQARAPYMPEIISFLPQFKLVVCSNEFMEIKSNDHGTWRRIRVVDFKSLFTENPVSGDKDKPYQFKLDRHITEKFEKWAPVLAWMLVQRAFTTNGVVADCDMVMSSSNSYRQSQDYVAEFVAACVATDKHGAVLKSALSSRFKEWYRSNCGERIPGPKDVFAHMDRMFGKYNGAWNGIRIKQDGEGGSNAGSTQDSDSDTEEIIEEEDEIANNVNNL